MLTTLRQRNFALLWFGGLISFAGDWALIIGLPVYVYDLTGSALATGAMFIAQSLPRLLLGSLAGVFVDRWDRKRTMVAANLAQALVLPALLLVRSSEGLWLLYLVAFVQTAISLFLQPAESALVPHLVSEEQLFTANSLLALSWELTRLIAPPLGGLLMGLFGVGSVVLVDSISFLGAGALIALIDLRGGAAVEPHSTTGDLAAGTLAAVWRDLRAGIQLVWQDRSIGALVIVAGVAMVSEGIGNVLGFPWLKQVLHGGALERGWLASAQAVGGLAGGLLIGRVSRALRPVYLIGLSGVMLGALSLALINIAAAPIDPALVFPLALVLKALQGLPIMGMFVSLETLLQSKVGDRYRGRIFGAYGATIALTMLIGQTAASTLGDVVGIVPVLDGVGSLYIFAGLLALVLLPKYGTLRSAYAPEQLNPTTEQV
jgi:MFS family permease